MHINAQYNQNDAPGSENRLITNLLVKPNTLDIKLDDISVEEDFWEIGGDFEHTFINGNRLKSLFIINQRDSNRLRERFDLDNNRSKDLFLKTFNQYEEKILRSSYSLSLNSTQDIELGVERAQTTLDSTLGHGLLSETGSISESFGGLTPITNSDATVEEVRYEAFAVHNWRINNRMSLESTLIFEKSTSSNIKTITKV